MKFTSRREFLPFALPDIDDTELIQVKEVLDSGWITTGPKARQFETDFAAYVGAKYAVAVNSCTAAMHLALEAVGVQSQDEVITTPYTFAATAEIIRYFGARPVFVDIKPDDLNLDPVLVEQAITARTKAIIPVHIAGLPPDLNAIYALAKKHSLAVIEDAAHAFPAKYKGHYIGAAPATNQGQFFEDGIAELSTNHKQHHYNGTQPPFTLPKSEKAPSDISIEKATSSVLSAVCFSFYATKTITTGEGGMICTDNEDLAERSRVMALHGISKDAWKRYEAEGSWYYEIFAPGYKYNMTDIAAAMGLAQLRKAKQMWQRRKEIALRYNEAFQPISELQIPADRSDCQHAWQLYILRLNPDQLKIGRNQFIEELRVKKIGTSVHFIPLHIHPYYRETFGYVPTDFPVALNEYQRAISLPIYSKMDDTDVAYVIQAVLELVEKYRVSQKQINFDYGLD